MSAATKAEAPETTRGNDTDDDGDQGSRELSTPLDMLLFDASQGPLRRFIPGMSGIRFTANLARRPQRVVRRGAGLVAELAKVGVGRSDLAPHEKDRRFSEEA